MGKIAEAENVRLITTDRYRNKQPCKWTEMPIFPLLKPIVMYLIPDDFSPERLKGKPSNRSVIRSIKSDCSGKWKYSDYGIVFILSQRENPCVRRDLSRHRRSGIIMSVAATNNRCEHFQCKRFFVVIFQQPIGTGSSLQSPFESFIIDDRIIV